MGSVNYFLLKVRYGIVDPDFLLCSAIRVLYSFLSSARRTKSTHPSNWARGISWITSCGLIMFAKSQNSVSL